MRRRITCIMQAGFYILRAERLIARALPKWPTENQLFIGDLESADFEIVTDNHYIRIVNEIVL